MRSLSAAVFRGPRTIARESPQVRTHAACAVGAGSASGLPIVTIRSTATGSPGWTSSPNVCVRLAIANLDRLRERRLGHKRYLADREYALGIESLERAVRREPLWRVHEPVFAVLALEPEPVEPLATAAEPLGSEVGFARPRGSIQGALVRRPLSVLCACAALSALSVAGLSDSAAARPTLAPAAPTVGATLVGDELLVTYESGSRVADRGRARGRTAGRLTERIVPGSASRSEVELVRLPAGTDRARAIRAISADPTVRYVEPNYTYRHEATSTDPRYTDGSLWGMSGRTTTPANPYGSNAAAAWAAGRTGSATVYVGVIDEGVQNTHPELSGQVRNPGETANGLDDDRNGRVDDVYGWDFVSNNGSVYDGGSTGSADDHGTHVAGTIGAKANGAGVVGVNWNVRLISAKFLGPNGGTSANAIKAIDYFTDLKRRGVNIVATNNSWSGGGYSRAMRDAIERANQAGILFVAAAGNGGSDGVGDNNDSAPTYPASYTNANVISVAAITRTGARASFSNYGATSVDLGAPGASIISTTAYNGYSTYSGTSMATPHVAGAAALYASVKPGSSAATIKAALLGSAVATPSMTGRTVTGGRLDVNAALAR